MNKLHIELASPYEKSDVALEETIAKRKSTRHFKDEALSFQDISQLLWAGQKVPSAGNVHPVKMYLTVKKAELLEPGVYRYWPERHSLSEVLDGPVGRELEQAAFGQIFLKQAPANIVIAVDYEKITRKYGPKGIVFAHMEAGHSSQNIYLQSHSLGLGTVAVGAFDEEKVRVLLNISEDEEILYLMPVGKPREEGK